MIRTLSCHCGAVRLECNAELTDLSECNCSTCARYGFIHWKVRHDQVRLATPRSGLSSYVWRFVDNGLHFCKACGVAMARTGCLDDVDVFTLDVGRYDGRTDIPGGDNVPLLADTSPS
jgi:hypothetical protein